MNPVAERVKALLAEGTVVRFWGFFPGSDPLHPQPALIRTPEEAERLVVGPLNAALLSRYLLETRRQPGRTGVVAKGCDALGIERMLRDFRLDREGLYLLGIPCHGVLDAGKLAAAGLTGTERLTDLGEEFKAETAAGERLLPKEEYLLGRCQTCRTHNPRLFDELVGEPVPDRPRRSRDYADVAAFEAQPGAERAAFWARQFERCLGCYACRNVCPACSCEVCFVDSENPRWLSAAPGPVDKETWHFTRAYHVAGRCIDCHECERVCPVGIPLMLLNHKFMQDIQELLDVPSPEIPLEAEALGFYRPDDPDPGRR